MNYEILSPQSIGGVFEKINIEIAKNKTYKGRDFSAVSVSKIGVGAKCNIVEEQNQKVLVVVADKLAAQNFVTKLNGYKENSAVLIPAKDDTLLNSKNLSSKQAQKRVLAFSKLLLNEVNIAVVSAEGFLQKYSNPKEIQRAIFDVKKNQNISPNDFLQRLIFCGYKRVEIVTSVGEFSLRGDVLDVFPVGDYAPARFSFFDEEIETIKTFDVETMKSICDLDSVKIVPISDMLLDSENVEQLKNFDFQSLPYNAQRSFSSMIQNAVVGACNVEMEWMRPFLSQNFSIQDFFEKGSLVCFDEPKLVADKISICQSEHIGRFKNLIESGEISSFHKNSIFDFKNLSGKLENFRLLSFSNFKATNPIFRATELFSPDIRPVTKYFLDEKSLVVDIKNFLNNGYKIVLCARSSESASNVYASLREKGASVSIEGDAEFSKCLVVPNGIENGFLYPEEKLMIVGASELLGKRHEERRVKQKSTVIDLKEGDYVVHNQHGVGICKGTTTMKMGEFEKEFIVLEYKNSDVLYVATDQMDNLNKFIGEDHPTLNKIGGKEFLRQKEKVKKSIRQLAINLLELYAKREKIKGYKYSKDNEFQNEFEDEFPYNETPDQLTAIQTIKEEMESAKVVDRLICGDVGFGKTEVAFRIMFKTVLDSKQVALLAPTTILCKQHYELLKERLAPFGIECGMLSRLQSNDENKKTLERIKNGEIYMVVATHRLLSKDVTFANLGLLVLDEEQRFGVEHKEKLKEKYPNINVLTLSATPIPRTLNMALSGVRDISLLETPPQGRLPVQTYVVEYSDALVCDAISRENARDGQTLILYNNVANIESFVSKLKSQLDDGIDVIYAHGQMSPLELEKRMTAFYEKKYQVLVSTTIIENGIDLPDANTLIVVDSEHFGLSQLYQLRGRVGRRGTLAHAYFTVPKSQEMTEIATKRLNALLENAEIGSGFKISIADLSIRGAGSMLGAEQHGHIEKVGYDMYLNLLNKSIEELKTGKVQEDSDIEFRVDASAYIRDNYVSQRDKLRIYKRISNLTSLREREDLENELTEIYGKIDAPIRNLMNIALIKNLAKGNDIKSVIVNKKGIGINFASESVFRNQQILQIVSEMPNVLTLTSKIPPTLVFNVGNKTPEQKLELLVRFFIGVHSKG